MATTKIDASPYVRQFAELKAALPGRGLSWLDKLREQAIERANEAGFPTTKVEEGKYTDLRRLTRTTFAPATETANGVVAKNLVPFLPEGLPYHLLVFVDGHYRPDLSDAGGLPEGVRVSALSGALERDVALLEGHLAANGALEGHAPVTLNAALMTDGAVITVPRGVTLERPVVLLYVSTAQEVPVAMHLRNLIIAEADSRATVLETYAAPHGGHYWTNAVTDVIAEGGAVLRHFKLQTESAKAFHLATTRTRLAQGSTYDSFVASLGSRLSRNELTATLGGEGIDCRLNGVFLARARQHLDNTTVIEHAEPGSTSEEYYKGVVDDDAHGVFQGKIVVHPHAQRTAAHQLNKNLLLSETAQVDTKPQLEIYADDVKCSHGATAGELDAEAMFYLRSRGLDTDLAERLLVQAFIGELVESIETEALKAHLWRVVGDWVPQVERLSERGGPWQ